MTETIFAPVTGRGGAVTVLRLSGPAACGIAAALAGALPPPRRAGLRRLLHGGAVLDHALVVSFPAPGSFTGEDCVELGLHGGRAVLAAVSAALVAHGARPAEPGEFSRRAFLNGRMDLLAAEAAADLIAAETEAQRRLAVGQADALGGAAAGWRETLRRLMARQEALIDFADEDLPPEVEAALRAETEALIAAIGAALAASPAAARLREGLEFVLQGPVNAGKSTLMNALAGEDVAIVSDMPGTTRDAISVRLDLGGVMVTLTDTAGLRETADAVEAEGVARARARAAGADLVIRLTPADAPLPEAVPTHGVLEVLTKADLVAPPEDRLAVSARTGLGMDRLLDRLRGAAAALTDTSAAPAPSRPRQEACLRDTQAALCRALEATEAELRAEDYRAAANALARLSGSIGVESVLDAVFSSFCIGK